MLDILLQDSTQRWLLQAVCPSLKFQPRRSRIAVMRVSVEAVGESIHLPYFRKTIESTAMIARDRLDRSVLAGKISVKRMRRREDWK